MSSQNQSKKDAETVKVNRELTDDEIAGVAGGVGAASGSGGSSPVHTMPSGSGSAGTVGPVHS